MPTARLVTASTLRVRSRDQRVDTASGVEAADRISTLLTPAVNELYAVTLDLASIAMSSADRQLATRLLGLMHRVDGAIALLREDLLAEADSVPATP